MRNYQRWICCAIFGMVFTPWSPQLAHSKNAVTKSSHYLWRKIVLKEIGVSFDVGYKNEEEFKNSKDDPWNLNPCDALWESKPKFKTCKGFLSTGPVLSENFSGQAYGGGGIVFDFTGHKELELQIHSWLVITHLFLFDTGFGDGIDFPANMPDDDNIFIEHLESSLRRQSIKMGEMEGKKYSSRDGRYQWLWLMPPDKQRFMGFVCSDVSNIDEKPELPDCDRFFNSIRFFKPVPPQKKTGKKRDNR